MTVTDQIEDHQARCLPHVLSLRMLARDALEAPLSLLAVAEVIRATEAILAEAETAAREARAAAGSRVPARRILRGRPPPPRLGRPSRRLDPRGPSTGSSHS